MAEATGQAGVREGGGARSGWWRSGGGWAWPWRDGGPGEHRPAGRMDTGHLEKRAPWSSGHPGEGTWEKRAAWGGRAAGTGGEPGAGGEPGRRGASAGRQPRSQLIAAAQALWIATLTDLGGRNTLLYYRGPPGRDARSRLRGPGHAWTSSASTGSIRLTRLFSDVDLRADAIRRVQAIYRKAQGTAGGARHPRRLPGHRWRAGTSCSLSRPPRCCCAG